MLMRCRLNRLHVDLNKLGNIPEAVAALRRTAARHSEPSSDRTLADGWAFGQMYSRESARRKLCRPGCTRTTIKPHTVIGKTRPSALDQPARAVRLDALLNLGHRLAV